MAYEAAEFEHFFIVRWGQPEGDDFAAVPRRVAAQAEREGRPLVYVGVLPDTLARIDDTTRKGFTQLTEEVLEHSAMLVVVFEARGFRAAMLRSALTAISLLSRRRDTLKYLDSVEAALEAAGDLLPADRTGIRAAIEATGTEVPPGW